MKVFIKKNDEMKFGYELFEIDENGQRIDREILEIVDDGKTLKLSENSSNRKYFSIRKVEEKGGMIELSYKNSIKLSNMSKKKSLEEYLTDDEKVVIENLLEKAKRRKEEEENRPKSEKEKLIEKINRLKEKLNILEEEEN